MHIITPSPLNLITVTATRKPYNARKIRCSVAETETDTDTFPVIKREKRVVLVRHGESTWNAEGRIQGSSNFSVLTSKGEYQAETSRKMLIHDSFDVCFTSPLARSKRTAEIIWGNRDAPMISDTDLREIDLYSFQGLLKREGKEKFGPAYNQWQVDAPNFIIDDHYPVRELWARARSCWDRILAHESESILVVAHNAVNQALVSTAIGLGTEYFRVLLQSNCGVTVLDFTPRVEGQSPNICLNRLNQTPGSPIAGGNSAGRKASSRIILVCHGSSENNAEVGDPPMNMLGVIQSQKIAEFLLDLKVNTVVSSPRKASTETAKTISRVQEAANYLGADSVPRYVDMKEMEQLSVETFFDQSKQDAIVDSIHRPSLNGHEDDLLDSLWNQTGKAWESLLQELSNSSSSEEEKVVVAVGHPVLHIALIAQCLNLTKNWLNSFHLDEGSITIIDFPDGVARKGVIQCVNYTAHLGRWSIPIAKSNCG